MNSFACDRLRSHSSRSLFSASIFRTDFSLVSLSRIKEWNSSFFSRSFFCRTERDLSRSMAIFRSSFRKTSGVCCCSLFGVVPSFLLDAFFGASAFSWGLPLLSAVLSCSSSLDSPLPSPLSSPSPSSSLFLLSSFFFSPFCFVSLSSSSSFAFPSPFSTLSSPSVSVSSSSWFFNTSTAFFSKKSISPCTLFNLRSVLSTILLISSSNILS
mmetsp:Transcript_35002/g.73837  ORF Transcript_35002/g.73837 Transcript_35002/m.73837 type:complete len:212 (+) Transcript_35002:267-902(+)